MFAGDVYEPLIVSGNVKKSDHAIYLENSVSFKDLTIFFFQLVDDMNLFLNETRQRLHLERVSAAQVPNRTAADYKPRVEAARLADYGLVAYVKEMITAPDRVGTGCILKLLFLS